MIQKFRAFANGHMFEVIEMVWRNGKIKYIRGILSNGGLIGGHRDYMDFSKIKLLQFTDLHDKNGNEIYESDYVKHLEINRCENEAGGEHVSSYCSIGIVRFIEGCWRLEEKNDKEGAFLHWLGNEGYCEIIGNIYENPELLEAHNGDNT